MQYEYFVKVINCNAVALKKTAAFDLPTGVSGKVGYLKQHIDFDTCAIKKHTRMLESVMCDNTINYFVEA